MSTNPCPTTNAYVALYRKFSKFSETEPMDISEKAAHGYVEQLIRKLPEKEQLILEFRQKQKLSLSQTADIMFARGYKTFTQDNLDTLCQCEEKSINHLQSFFEFSKQLTTPLKVYKSLDTSVCDMGFSEKTLKGLTRAGIKTARDLSTMKFSDLGECRTMSRASHLEIAKIMKDEYCVEIKDNTVEGAAQRFAEKVKQNPDISLQELLPIERYLLHQVNPKTLASLADAPEHLFKHLRAA